MSFDRPSDPITVAGPSHARRYRNAVEVGRLAPPRRPIAWMDIASASMLHPQFRSASFANEPEPALVFVPDFRIGNRSLRDPEATQSYIGVAKELISPENDRRIYANIMDEVLRIRDANPEARFLFWCLGGREYMNRVRGAYNTPQGYRHPVWNLGEVEDAVGDRVISLQPMFEHPLAPMIHIDGSAHPSNVGLDLFRRMTDRPDVPVDAHLDAIAADLQRPVIQIPKDTVLSGDSHWLEALRLYASKGLVRLAPGVRTRTVDELLEQDPGDRPRVLFISNLVTAHGDDAAAPIDRTVATVEALLAKGYNPRIFVWESRAIGAMDARRRYPPRDPRSTQSLHEALAQRGLRGRLIFEGGSTPSFIRPRDVEVSHPVGPMPTLDGLLAVVRAIGGNHRLEFV